MSISYEQVWKEAITEFLENKGEKITKWGLVEEEFSDKIPDRLFGILACTEENPYKTTGILVDCILDEKEEFKFNLSMGRKVTESEGGGGICVFGKHNRENGHNKENFIETLEEMFCKLQK